MIHKRHVQLKATKVGHGSNSEVVSVWDDKRRRTLSFDRVTDETKCMCIRR